MELLESLMPASLLQEGLGSGALQEFLDSIDKQTEQIKLGLLAAFGEQAARGGDIDPALLSAMVSLASVAPTPGGPESYIADAAQKYIEIQEQVAALQAELKAAQAAADLEATLRVFRQFLENGQYMDAAESMVQLRKIVDDARSKSGGAGAWQQQQHGYYGHQQHKQQHDDAEVAQLAEACARCEGELEEALEAACQEAVDVSVPARVLTITASLPSGGDVADLWAALELAGMARRHLEWVAGTLLEHVLPPVLDGTARFDAHVAHGGDSAIVKWLAVPPGAPATPNSVGRVEADCAQLLRVLADALFRGRASTLAAFGAAFWPRFVCLYQAAFERQLVSQGAAVLRGRQAAAAAMEAAARDLGLLADLSGGGPSLGEALGRAVQASYHAAQAEYLERARQAAARAGAGAAAVTVGAPLPLDGAFYQRYQAGQVKAWEALDPPSGWDTSGPVLATGFYQVSAAVLEVAQITDDALTDAVVSGDASLAQACVVAVSKVAAMFAALVPAPSASDAPQPVLLRHNDLKYLANHLLLLPFLHSPELERLVGGEVWFGDDALRLRAQARALANESLSVQQAALSEPLSQLLPLAAAAEAAASSSRGRAAAAAAGDASPHAAGPERAIKQLLYTLERAGRLVWPTLPPGEALDFSARLLGPLFKALSDDVLGMDDIGEAECEGIVALCRPLVAGAPAALLAVVDGTGQRQGLDAGGGVDVKALLEDALQQRAWGLRKLSAILALLEAKLTDIVRRWESGELRRAGLSRAEVERVVVAVFENTDHRAQCLQRIDAADA